jgi:hypothetical protein
LRELVELLLLCIILMRYTYSLFLVQGNNVLPLIGFELKHVEEERWPNGYGVCLSNQGSRVRALTGSQPCFFICHQYWLVPESGHEND